MKMYKVGNFTIVTDSYITWVREYEKTIKDACTNIYLGFLPLFKTQEQKVQNFIIIFDDYRDFVRHAVDDGVPGWAVSGYFSPKDETLYLYNVLGDKMSKILFDAVVGQSGRQIDNIVDRISAHASKEQQMMIEGRAKRIKDKFWQAYTYYKEMYRRATLATLRHEFAHELFHNWNLQTIVLSKAEKDKKRLEEMKKEFIDTKDAKKTAEFIKKMITFKSDPIDMDAANSWLVEGIATYCETDTPGRVNKRWLYIYQQLAKQNGVYPIEVLTSYKMGSFPGVCPQAVHELYAQSWALVTFLMRNYPREFLRYQLKLVTESKEAYKNVELLTMALNKDVKTIEQEFKKYMSRFKPVKEPFIAEFDKIMEIMRD